MSWKSMAAAIFLVTVALPAGVNAQEATPSQPDDQAAGGAAPWMGPWMMGPDGVSGGAMGPWMMGSYGTSPMMAWRGHANYMCQNMTRYIDGRLAFLQAELKITRGQETLWQHYADAVRNNSQKMAEHCSAMIGKQGASALSLPERLDLHESFMAAQLEALRTMGHSLKPLYEALSDTQKKAADQLIWGPMGMM